jgi:hypothetical protein
VRCRGFWNHHCRLNFVGMQRPMCLLLLRQTKYN